MGVVGVCVPTDVSAHSPLHVLPVVLASGAALPISTHPMHGFTRRSVPPLPGRCGMGEGWSGGMDSKDRSYLNTQHVHMQRSRYTNRAPSLLPHSPSLPSIVLRFPVTSFNSITPPPFPTSPLNPYLSQPHLSHHLPPLTHNPPRPPPTPPHPPSQHPLTTPNPLPTHPHPRSTPLAPPSPTPDSPGEWEDGLRERLNGADPVRVVKEAPYVQIPLGVTEDRLVGTVDIEASMKVRV